MENYKNKLQEYTMKLALPLPIYESEREGAEHLPTFKSYVTVNGMKYESSPGHRHKREAEQSAAQAAVIDLSSDESVKPYKLDEVLGKRLLSELLVKLDRPSPSYSFTVEGASHCPVFTATVEINGVTYVGGQGKSKKQAETKAAFAAFQAINAQIGRGCSQFQLPAESKETRDLKQPIEECKDVKSELETITNCHTPTTCYTPKKQFLVGTTSCQAERALEKWHAENIHPVEMGSRNSNVNNVSLACATLMHNHLEQKSLPVQQCELNKESEDVIQHQEYGSEETEENKQVVQEDRLTESINKRNRSELNMDSKKTEDKMKRQRITTRSHRSTGN